VSRSRTYLTLVILLVTMLGILASWSRQVAADLDRNRLPAMRQLVSTLQLTDLALWSEARYTRHPAMADLFSAFQDHPGALEHFPAGSLLAPCGPRPETTIVVRRHNEPPR
jgi:hypothetical protein